MSWFGSDLVAIGCILGGAAVGGATTLAFMDGGERADMRCGVEAVALTPKIAIAHGGDTGAIVVTPNVRVHSRRHCPEHRGKVVEIHLDHQLQQMEAQLEHLDHALGIQMEALEGQIESQLEQEMEARLHFEEAIQGMQEAKIKMIVRKVEGGGI